MRKWFSSLGLNARLAAAASLLGAVALFADPFRGPSVAIEPAELAAVVARGADHVSAKDLAGWIIAGRSDVRLLDLRDPSAFAQYHLPGAESAPIGALPDYPVAANERIVLYSEDDAHASQAWVLLRAKGYKGVYTLAGGLAAWKDEVLFPRLAEAATPDQRADNDRRAAVSARLGGRPLAGGAGDAVPAVMALPTVDAPVSLPPGAKAPAKKKKKEGC